MRSSTVKCVIFDCEGVLVDSEMLRCQALANVFSRYGSVGKASDFVAHYNGGKLAEILAENKKRLGITVSLDILEPEYRKELDNLFKSKLKPIEGVVDLLDKFDELGVEYGVISNGPLSKMDFALSIAGLSNRFEGKCFSAFDANSWKPEPDLLLYAIMNMGYVACECIYVDDTVRGIKTGINAGVETYHFHPQKEQPSSGFDEVKQVSDLSEILRTVTSALGRASA